MLTAVFLLRRHEQDGSDSLIEKKRRPGDESIVTTMAQFRHLLNNGVECSDLYRHVRGEAPRSEQVLSPHDADESCERAILNAFFCLYLCACAGSFLHCLDSAGGQISTALFKLCLQLLQVLTTEELCTTLQGCRSGRRIGPRSPCCSTGAQGLWIQAWGSARQNEDSTSD